MLSSILKILLLFVGIGSATNVNRGSTPITTWDGFKREVKEQFYPKDPMKETRAKLRRLQHKRGHLREYVKKFEEFLLEIPNMGEEEALFAYMA